MSKFINYNSAECQVLKQVFEEIPMMDSYVSNIVEEYIYSTERKYFCDTNIIMCEYTTKHGKLHGNYKNFYDNGNTWSLYNYKDGVLEGWFLQFYKNGQKQIECKFKNGKEVGICYEWSSKGKLIYTIIYKDGKIIDCTKFQ